ncbi:MAG: SpoIID/LytB domain-containing protein [Clostridia bacterium]|nr:SpoIID/LytB domain-containing protein [Clostridia bacterium]
MKKIVIMIIVLVQIIFLIPVIFTKKFDTKEVSAKTEENKNEIVEETKNTEYDYGNYQTIHLLHQKTGEVEEVNLDEYLCHVVSAEMPVTFEIEALKAQAVVARTYTIYKITENQNKHENADICDSSSCCQAWISKEDRFAKWEEKAREENWRKIEQAVYDTKGKMITYEGKPINAFFHSNSGGKTETPINVWGGSYPYLQSVETSRRGCIFTVLF